MSAIGHLVDDVLPVLQLSAMVRLGAPAVVPPLGQVLKRGSQTDNVDESSPLIVKDFAQI